MASSTDNICCVCQEGYNLDERKPLLLPCSHTFCKSCLQEIKTRNECLCPVCRRSWGGQSVDGLPFVRQLADTSDNTNTKNKIKSVENQGICAKHNSEIIAWCKDCTVQICLECLNINHKSCNLGSIKEMHTELISKVKETVSSTGKKLIEKFTQRKIENNSQLSEIRENLKKMQGHEKIAVSFLKELSRKQEKTMNKLEEYANISTNDSVTQLNTTISKILSLLDDPIDVPRIPKVVVPDCAFLADDTDSDDEPLFRVGQELENLFENIFRGAAISRDLVRHL